MHTLRDSYATYLLEAGVRARNIQQCLGRRSLNYTGGAFAKSDGKSHCSQIDFLLPVKAKSKIFKAKFRDSMEKTDFIP